MSPPKHRVKFPVCNAILTIENELEGFEIVIRGQQLECIANTISSTTRFKNATTMFDLSWVGDEDCAQEIKS